MSWRVVIRALGGLMVGAAWSWLIAIPLLWIVSFAYDSLAHPHDMNLPGLLAVASVFYLLPWWPVLYFGGRWLRKLGG